MSSLFYILLLISYLLGSIPFGLLISKMYGIDIRLHGSKNIGATNVYRILGKKLGLFTFFLDGLKGFLPTFLFPIIIGINDLDISALFGVTAIIGHSFSVFLKFKGGKGVATSTGMIIGVLPFIFFIGLLVWIILFLIFRYVSLASIFGILTITICSWLNNQSSLYLNILISLISILIIFLHRENIIRLINGTENKFSK